MKDFKELLIKVGFVGVVWILSVVGLFIIMLSFDNRNQTEKIITKIDEIATSENVVTKEVIKEVPVEVEVIKEVPVEVTKEVLIHDDSYDAIEISPEEYDLLARILALEAKNQPDVGQRAVVEVVLNRVLNDWGASVWDVLMAAGQFSTVKYLDCPYATPEAKEYANVDYVLEHGRTVFPGDYVYFASYKANGTNYIQIQDHYFGEER